MKQITSVFSQNCINYQFSIIFLIVVGWCVTPLYAATGENAVKKYPYERVADKKESPFLSEQKMKLEEGKLSARFVSTPLKQVMEEFGKLCDVEILWSRQESEEPISVWFTNKAPDKAIQEILDGRSYLLAYKSVNNEGTLAKVTILDSDSEYSAIEPLFTQSYHRIKSEDREHSQLSTKNNWNSRQFGENMENEEYGHVNNKRNQIESITSHSISMKQDSGIDQRNKSDSMPLDMLIQMADEQKRALRMQKEKYPRLKKRRISDSSKILQSLFRGDR